jgi:hypothetical protein
MDQKRPIWSSRSKSLFHFTQKFPLKNVCRVPLFQLSFGCCHGAVKRDGKSIAEIRGTSVTNLLVDANLNTSLCICTYIGAGCDSSSRIFCCYLFHSHVCYICLFSSIYFIAWSKVVFYTAAPVKFERNSSREISSCVASPFCYD